MMESRFLRGVLLLSSLLSSWAFAFTIIGPKKFIPEVTGEDGDKVTLFSIGKEPYVKYLPASGDDAEKLKEEIVQEFKDWTVEVDGELEGTLEILKYIAYMPVEHSGGAEFFAKFKGSGAGKDGPIRWVQLLDFNARPDKDCKNPPPHIDPCPNHDDKPFYYNEGEEFEGSSRPDSILFYDKFALICSEHPQSLWWRARLFPVTWDGKKKITIHDGILWGFDLKCVPEPSSLMGVGIGILFSMVSLVRRHRTSKNIS